MSLSFPDVDLPVIVKAAFGADPAGSPGTWDFEDLTARLLDTPAIVDTVSRRVSSSVCDASSTSLSLDNDDGELTPLRALSSKFPYVVRDVPVKFQLRRADDTFTRTTSNGWGVSDSGHTWTSSGGSAADYSTTGSQGSVAVGATTSDRITVVDIGGQHQDVRITATTNSTPTGATIDTGVVARYADASNFYIAGARVSTGGTVTAFIAKRVAGVLSDIETAATGLSTATSKQIRFRVHENRLQLKVWLTSGTEPDVWDIDLFDDSLATGDSAGSFSRRAASNTNPTTFTYDSFDTTHTFRAGHADVWNTDIIPTTEGAGGELCTTRLTFSGPIRRLTKGAQPLRSPLFRSLTNVRGEFIPLAYTPMEDNSGATQFASGLIGGSPMTFTGDVSPSSDSVLMGSAPLPIFGASGRAQMAVPSYVDTDYWLVAALIYVPEALSASTNITVLTVQTNGTAIGSFTMFLDMDAGEFGVARYAPGGGLIASTSTAWDASDGTPLGNWIWATMTCRKDEFGSDDHIQANLQRLDAVNPLDGGFGNYGETIGATGYGQATFVGVNGALSPAPAGGEGMGYGHAWLMTDPQFDVSGDVRDYVMPALAWISETAAARALRLSLEEGVPISIAPGDTVQMGPQLIDTYFNNVALCAESDMGVLAEDEFGLSFIPREARYNRPTSLTIDMATYENLQGESGQVVSPTYDDAEFRNGTVVNNVNGSEATFKDNSVTPLDHFTRVDVSLYNDQELIQQAAFRTAVSGFDTHRYPDTPISLTANPAMVGAWLGVTTGLTRIVRTGLPAKGPDGDIDEVVASYTQRILRRQWEVNYTGAPAVPWDIGVYDDDEARYDTDSVLDGDYAADATSITVVTPASEYRWRTTAEDATVFPIYVKINGVRVTVNGITSSTQTQTFSIDAPGKALTDGAPVSLWKPARYGL
jgi:hypothetical protein